MRFLIIIALFFTFGTYSQDSIDTAVDPYATLEENPYTYQRFLDVVENSLFEYYKETWGKERAYGIIDSLGYEEKDVPTFSDSVYIERLKRLDDATIIDIEINDDLLKTLKYFVSNRRKYTAICLGRSKLYFPMYEEHLDKYQIPLELKYLSVIESGLRPTVKSRVGATGLWQFMYQTGRMFGLESDSYVDERMDPVKSTDAACRYLKYLFGLYGDWSIALAAYNAGPGNVNKAIRRSGGKMNYWDLRPFLPTETQMYVPNFICMLYMMTYYGEHNIIPNEAQVYLHEIDTVCLKSSVRISCLDTMIGLSSEEFLFLNPIYKTDVIPKTDEKQCIYLPVEKIDTFLVLEERIYAHDAYMDSTGKSFIALEKKKTHVVLSNETLVQIAQKYDVSVNDIRVWNDLTTSTIYPGQRLTIRIKERKYFEASTPGTTTASTTTPPQSNSGQSPNTTKTTDDGNYQYYSLKSGESLWTVSQKLGIPFDTIQKLNADLDPKKMQPGDQIKIKRL